MAEKPKQVLVPETPDHPAHPLLDMSAFVANNTSVEDSWDSSDPIWIYLNTRRRLSLTAQSTNAVDNVSATLQRGQTLMEVGIIPAEADSASFAKNLHAAISPHLSDRNLDDLVAVFSAAVADRQESKQKQWGPKYNKPR